VPKTQKKYKCEPKECKYDPHCPVEIKKKEIGKELTRREWVEKINI
jgi:hypothetical protein